MPAGEKGLPEGPCRKAPCGFWEAKPEVVTDQCLRMKQKGRPGGRPLLLGEEQLLAVFVFRLLPLEKVAEGGAAGVG